MGRESGQARLRVVHHTDKETLVHHVHSATLAEAVVFTDEWQSYNHIIRTHATVCHSAKERARYDDGDGIREVHVNRRKACGQQCAISYVLSVAFTKDTSRGYVAICEFSINLKRITPSFSQPGRSALQILT